VKEKRWCCLIINLYWEGFYEEKGEVSARHTRYAERKIRIDEKEMKARESVP
jgi:hypothetical protein